MNPIPLVLIIFLLLFAWLAYRNERTRGFTFSLTILAVVIYGLQYPEHITSIGDIETKQFISPLLMLLMFCMGTSMKFQDFIGVLKMPKGVLIGILCQFSIMPLIGWSLTRLFSFPPEIAAGVILVGCSPSGLASNVMSYIAKANLALSLTLTAVATLIAPLVTPFLMKLLANQLVPIDFWSMFMSIIKIVIIPIILGIFFNALTQDKLTKLKAFLPTLAQISIGLVILIITALGSASLLQIGISLIAVVILHNTFGYLVGFYLCKAMKLDEQSCRTIALEVGMQNSGLASAIALEMGKVATMGLPSAVFGPFMNISGSCLASWWGDRQPNEL